MPFASTPVIASTGNTTAATMNTTPPIRYHTSIEERGARRFRSLFKASGRSIRAMYISAGTSGLNAKSAPIQEAPMLHTATKT